MISIKPFPKSWMTAKKNYSNQRWNVIRVGFWVFLLMPLASSWISGAIEDVIVQGNFSGDVMRPWAILAVTGLVLIIIGLFILKELTERLVPAVVKTIEGPHKKRRVVIAFLSTIGSGSARADELISKNVSKQGISGWEIKDNHGQPVLVRTLSDWVHHDPKQKLTSWQQLARGIFYHWNDGPLELVILIASKEQNGKPGSEKDASHACAVFEDLLNAGDAPNRRVQVVAHPPNGIDFENLEEIIDALKKALEEARRKGFSQDSDTVIDVTGGQKTTSIAGALVTLDRRDLIFQYVPTDAGGLGFPKAYQTTTATSTYS